MTEEGYPPQYNNDKQYNYPMPSPQQCPASGRYGQYRSYPPPSGYPRNPPPHSGQYPPPPPGPYPPPQGYGQPIVNQPMGGPSRDSWMNMPKGHPYCPPGLEYLTTIDQLLVHQEVEMLEALIGFETKNKYTIRNSLGQRVYYAVEESQCLSRNCCDCIRPFDMTILDNYENEVLRLSRPFACGCCCSPCCLQSIKVSSAPRALLGTVQQEWSIFKQYFTICDSAGNVVLRIEGPICPISMGGNDVEFKVMSRDGAHQVGRISKQWSGVLREWFTDADYFGITFPVDLDVPMKAVMLGACFLIDFMFFEN